MISEEICLHINPFFANASCLEQLNIVQDRSIPKSMLQILGQIVLLNYIQQKRPLAGDYGDY